MNTHNFYFIHRYKKLYSGRQRFKTDGLSDLKYKVLKIELKKLYTWILVDPMKGSKRSKR
jgi:hypothetical protein